MCGIAGIVNFIKEKSVDSQLLKKIADIIYYRGPDDEGFHVKDNIGLGMRRLSIIDLLSGHQPIYNEDLSICIVYNGEVYNYRELKKSLQDKGHNFATNSDTEVIVHAYEEYGEHCVAYLRGMFAFALWDENNQRLLLARDRVGIKPVHYYIDSKRFIFGSEIKSILQHPEIDREIDWYALDEYLTYGVVPAPRTIYKNIKKLLPGHILTYQEGNYKIERYWKLTFDEELDKSEADYVDELAEILKEAVKIRLISDVPLGAFLSGGLDSSLVVALMSEVSDEPVKTFSIGFEDEEFNELKYARIVAKHCSTEHHEFIVKPNIEEELPRLLSSFDEPFFDSSAIPTYFVSKMAREFVTVCLSGDGGDELFAGYDHYLPLQKRQALLQSFSPFIHKGAIRLISKSLPFGTKGRNFLNRLSLSGPEYYAESCAKFSQMEKRDLYTDDFLEKVSSNSPYQRIKQYYDERGSDSFLKKMIYVDFMTYLSDDILTKVDRMSMLNSLEVRVPILDHIFVEYVNKIPIDYKLRGTETKYIFRRLMEKFLPKEITQRGKMGFAIPMNRWLRGELKDICVDALCSSEFVKMGLFKGNIVNKILEFHYTGKRNYSNLIWVLFCLELWRRNGI